MTTLGIDLGTTNSVPAILEAGHPKALRNRDGLEYTSSIITVHKTKGEMLVGFAARNHAALNPGNSVMSIKRLMGRAFDDEKVERYRKKYPYLKLEPAEGDAGGVRLRLGDKQLSPIDISAMILRKIKSDAEELHAAAFTHAVITVPAYFTDSQRDATRRAGEAAGFIVKQVVAEPTAAAIAFGMDLDAHDDRVVLVYDLGGGTFDVALLSAAGGAFDVMAVEGDMWLGGDDFDELIMNEVLRRVQRAHGVNGRDTPRFMTQLRHAAEATKVGLSQQASATVSVHAALRDADDEALDIEEDISRDQFESWIAPLIARSVDLTQKVLRDANFSPGDIDTVLLVGGSTLVPMVRRELEAVFGKEKLNQKIDPMKSVAFGAAHLAARIAHWRCTKTACGFERNVDTDLKCQKCGSTPSVVELRVTCPKCGRINESGAAECGECGRKQVADFQDVVAIPYGIEIDGGVYDEVISKGTSLPMRVAVRKPYYTVRPGQELIEVPVYQGESQSAQENELQGIVKLQIPPNLPERERVDVEMRVDADGIIQVVVECAGKQVSAVMKRDALAADVHKSMATGAGKPVDEEPSSDRELFFTMLVADTMLKYLRLPGLGNPAAAAALEKCLTDGRRSEERRDAALARQVSGRINKLRGDDIGSPVAELAMMDIYMNRFPEELGDHALRAQLRRALKDFTSLLKARRAAEAKALFENEMVELFGRFIDSLPDREAGNARGLLGRSR